MQSKDMEDVLRRLSQLEQRMEDVIRLVQQADRYVNDDPDAAANKVRKALEALVSRACVHFSGRPPQSNQLAPMIKEIEPHVRRPILSLMHSVRDLTNIGSHDQSATQDEVKPADALRALSGLAEIIQWYLEEVGRTEQRPEAQRPSGEWLKSYLRPLDFAGEVERRSAGFVGREWLMDEIDARQEGEGVRGVLVTGDPGAGKSALAAQYVRANPRKRVLCCHFCDASDLQTLKPGRFVQGVAFRLAETVPEYGVRVTEAAVKEALSAGRCEEDPVGSFREGVLQPLASVAPPAGGVGYLLVDALDEAASAKESKTIVSVLAASLERFPAWLRLLVTSRRVPAVTQKLGALQECPLLAEEARNQRDVERCIETRLKEPDFAERLLRAQVSAEAAVRALYGKSEGNFLYVVQALQALGKDQYGFDRLDELPRGLAGLHAHAFEFLYPLGDSGGAGRWARTLKLLQVAVAAYEPLTAPELAAGSGQKQADVDRSLRELAAYMPDREGEGNERRYGLFHKSLADWLASSNRETGAGEYFVDAEKGHAALAGWGLGAWQRGARTMPGYALRHLPKHLVATEHWEELTNLLCDLGFLEAKTAAGLVFDLAADFTAAVKALPESRPGRRILRLLEEALRRDIQFIARHAQDYPQGLFQCLWNSAWWYDCPEAEKHYVVPEGGWKTPPPWTKPVLAPLLEKWRAEKEGATAGFKWVRSLRPPRLRLGTAQKMVLRGHEGSVNSAAFSPDGQRIVSGSHDKTVRVWDAHSGAELRCLRGHEGWVRSVAFSPDGQRIVSGSHDKTVRVWDAHSGAELRCLRGHEGWVRSVAFSPDGQRIVSGSDDKTVRVWEAGSGAELRCLRGHEREVFSAAFSLDGQRIVSGSEDNTVRVWDARSGAELHCLRGHQASVTSVAFSADSQRIVSGSEDNTVRVWDARSGAELHCLRGHQASVTSVAFSADSQRIVSGSWDNTVRVWDAHSGAELRCLQGHEHYVSSVAFSPDSQRIVSAGGYKDQTVRIWEAGSGAELRCLRGHEHYVSSVAFSPDGQLIVSGSHNKTVRVWEVDSGKELHCLRGHEDGVYSVAFSPDGQRIVSGSGTVLGASVDNTVRVWDAGSGAELRCLGHEGGVSSVAFSPDGRRIVSCSGLSVGIDNKPVPVRVWDADSGAELLCLRDDLAFLVSSVVFSPDGQRIVGGHKDWLLLVWDAGSGTKLHVVQSATDSAAIAAGLQRFPWRALERMLETAIEDAKNRQPAAWFGEAMDWITTHPSGRIWAGRVANRLCLIKLEGGEAMDRRLVTPVRLWLFGPGGDAGHWDDHLTAACPWCGRRFAFEEPLPLGQEITCPLDGCGKRLAVDTVVCDNRAQT